MFVKSKLTPRNGQIHEITLFLLQFSFLGSAQCLVKRKSGGIFSKKNYLPLPLCQPTFSVELSLQYNSIPVVWAPLPCPCHIVQSLNILHHLGLQLRDYQQIPGLLNLLNQTENKNIFIASFSYLHRGVAYGWWLPDVLHVHCQDGEAML